MSKTFWTLDKNGNEVLRDLSQENESFTIDGYRNGEFDNYNYIWHEMFDNHIYDDNGCDYERYGCYIKNDDVVLDIGGNIGVFAHRAELRGASKVISFEPLTPTFNCLLKNAGKKTSVYKMAVGDKNKWVDFNIHTNYTHIGGGFSNNDILNGRTIIYSEKSYMIDINDIFNGLSEKIDFIKMDIEGGEVDALNAITNKNLSSIRCLSAEFHKVNDDFEIFQSDFINRMNTLGFQSFVLYYGDGNLRTVNFWK